MVSGTVCHNHRPNAEVPKQRGSRRRWKEERCMTTKHSLPVDTQIGSRKAREGAYRRSGSTACYKRHGRSRNTGAPNRAEAHRSMQR